MATEHGEGKMTVSRKLRNDQLLPAVHQIIINSFKLSEATPLVVTPVAEVVSSTYYFSNIVELEGRANSQ